MATASETERAVRACIDRFLAEIRELIRRQALAVVRERLEARIAELVREYVALHPGLDFAGLRSALDMSNDELRGPLRSLIQQGQLRTSGRGRGMRYLPAAAAKGEPRARAAGRARRRGPARIQRTAGKAPEGRERQLAPLSSAEEPPPSSPPPAELVSAPASASPTSGLPASASPTSPSVASAFIGEPELAIARA